MLTADQLTFYEKLPVHRLQLPHIQVEDSLQFLVGERAATNCFFDGQAIVIGSFANERVVSKIPRQTNAATNDNVGFRARASEPFTT